MKFSHNLDHVASSLSILLVQYAQKTTKSLDRVVFEQASQLKADIQIDWPVDTGYSRAAWQGPTKLGEAYYELRNPVVYAAVLEYGSYRGIGPKTVKVSGQRTGQGIALNAGIYSRQSIAPMRRALSERMTILKSEILKATKP